MAAAVEERVERLSIYRASRSIKRMDNSLYNALRSIYEDSIFVAEIAGLWPDLPLIANLRCGLWYSSRFDSTCYFKSTDGHTNNCSFSTARLNLHVARLAGQRGGCIIVDSTRRGKRFPDSMSKTIPIWACVLNRAIKKRLQRMHSEGPRYLELESNISTNQTADGHLNSIDYDSSLYLPLWVPHTEKAAIEECLDEWTTQLEACGADIGCLASILKKPLRPLWISHKTLIWLNEIPDYDSWDFTPIILVSASATDGLIQHRTTSEFSWHYISGAGDDEESWARSLTPNLFWKHAFDLIDSGPDLCNRRVAEIVEKERVYHAQRSEYSPQVTFKPQKLVTDDSTFDVESSIGCQFMNVELSTNVTSTRPSNEERSIFWLGSTNLAVTGTLHVAHLVGDVDCMLNCDNKLEATFHFSSADAYLHLPIMTSKVDKFSIFHNLPCAIEFAKLNLSRGKKLLICCHNGEDISVCVCLAILTYLFDDGGSFDGGKYFMETCITKQEMRRRLVFICKFAIKARPCRGNLKQMELLALFALLETLAQRKWQHLIVHVDARSAAELVAKGPPSVWLNW